MTTDVRPPGLNLFFRPGTTVTLTLSGWGTSALAGRTFQAFLGADALSVSINGANDVMTIVADDLITDNYPTAVTNFVLNEQISGTMEPIIIGKWTPSLKAREATVSSATLSVASGATAVTVSISGEQAGVSAHAAVQGTHGWTLDGTTIRWNGAIQTNHDAMYFYPHDMAGTAQFVENAGTLNAPPYWAFDSAAVERVKWLWTPGDDWDDYVVRFGWINLGLGASGNVVWRYYERRNTVNSGSPGGNWTTTPTQVAQITSAAPNGLDANKYEDLAVDVPVSPLTVVLSVIERIATDAADTLNATDAAIYIATATRT